MELADEFTEQIIRYAFLLGSALRNENTEQFCDIYDSIIPTTLSSDQVEGIKDTARSIADLEEEEYNELVVRARDFSLAQSSLALAMINNNEALRSFSSSSSVTGGSSVPSDLKYMDMEDEISSSRGAKPDMESLTRTSRYFVPSSCSSKAEFDAAEDGDSGVFNSSKNTAGSVSDQDLTDTCESRAGYFHYCPSESIPCCNSTSSQEDGDQDVSVWASKLQGREQERLNDKAYDASFDADTDIDCQTQSKDITKLPPSKTEIEMDTITPSSSQGRNYPSNDFQKKIYNDFIKKKNSEMYDEAHSNDSDNSCEDLQSVVVHNSAVDDWSYNVHKTLYTGNNCYASMAPEYNDNDAEYGSKSSLKNHYGSSSGPDESQLFFHSSPSYGATRTYSNSAANRSVDSGVRFPLGGSSRHTSSDSVKIDKTVKIRDQRGPPFGDPLSIGEISRSTERLIDGRGRSEAVPNLPRAVPISHSFSENRGTSLEDPIKQDKKKKKKKKDKDDGDACEDENGNPIESARDGFGSDKSEPLGSQMKSHWDYNFHSLKEYLPTKDPPDDAMAPALDTQQAKKQRRRKRKEDKSILSETLPGYIGDRDVNELLSFIDGTNATTKNNNKKLQLPNNRQERDKPAVPTPATNVIPTSPPVVVDNSTTLAPKVDNKGKKKKKNKTISNSSKASSEVDDRSSRTSEVDADRTRDLIEANIGTELTNLSALISSSKASSIDDPLEPIYITNSYIFTDFDTKIQKEEQFTVVTKKKKKAIPSPKDFVRDSMSDGRKEDVTFRRRSRPLQRSYTPPPIASSTSNQEKPSERTLSPSAFPVLGNSREARRNSTGNVSELGGNYDSDVDSSVKSVPVTGSSSETGRLGGDVSMAAGYKPPSISYASITAGSKASQNSSGSTSSQDGDHLPAGCTCGVAMEYSEPNSDTTPEDNGAVKISSDNKTDDCGDAAPEPGASVHVRPSSASSTIPRATAELSQGQSSSCSPYTISINSSGSGCSKEQDNIRKSDESTDHANAVGPNEPVSEPKGDGSHAAHASGDHGSSGPAEAVGKEIDVNDSADFPALAQTTSPAPPSHKSPSHVDTASSADIIPVQPISSLRVESSSAGLVSTPRNVVSSCKANSVKTVQPAAAQAASSVAKPPQAPRNFASKSKSKTLKSVIFLDKRMNEGPKNLDISFGFEPDLDNNVMSSSAKLDSSSTCSSDSGRGTDSDHYVHIILDKSDNNNIDQGPVNLDNRTDNSSGVILNHHPLAQHPAQAHHGNDNGYNGSQLVFMSPEHPKPSKQVNITPEDLHKLKMAAPNGVVVPTGAEQAEQLLTAERNRINAAAVEESNPQQQQQQECDGASVKGSNLSQSTDKSSVFVYERTSDPNFQVGQFNHEAGVSFLFTDWQKMPTSATVYSDASNMVAC